MVTDEEKGAAEPGDDGAERLYRRILRGMEGERYADGAFCGEHGGTGGKEDAAGFPQNKVMEIAVRTYYKRAGAAPNDR